MVDGANGQNGGSALNRVEMDLKEEKDIATARRQNMEGMCVLIIQWKLERATHISAKVS